MLELMRRRLGGLVKLIERSKRATDFTDFTDFTDPSSRPHTRSSPFAKAVEAMSCACRRNRSWAGSTSCLASWRRSTTRSNRLAASSFMAVGRPARLPPVSSAASGVSRCSARIRRSTRPGAAAGEIPAKAGRALRPVGLCLRASVGRNALIEAVDQYVLGLEQPLGRRLTHLERLQVRDHFLVAEMPSRTNYTKWRRFDTAMPKQWAPAANGPGSHHR